MLTMLTCQDCVNDLTSIILTRLNCCVFLSSHMCPARHIGLGRRQAPGAGCLLWPWGGGGGGKHVSLSTAPRQPLGGHFIKRY